MSQLFNPKLAKMVTRSLDWQQAVQEGVQILVEHGYATSGLANAIFKTTQEHGAYYVLERGLALLHAPLGPYCLNLGASLVLLKDNVQFNGEDKWARVIITLAAVDADSHMGYIQELGTLFTNKVTKAKLLAAPSLQDFFAVVNQALKGGANHDN